jgi:hypothetical protein
MISVGQEGSERQYCIWDPKNMSKPLCKNTLKDATGTSFGIHLNASNNILYVTAKGAQEAQIFYWKPDSTLSLINKSKFKRG